MTQGEAAMTQGEAAMTRGEALMHTWATAPPCGRRGAVSRPQR